jgi:hypothetical protein
MRKQTSLALIIYGQKPVPSWLLIRPTNVKFMPFDDFLGRAFALVHWSCRHFGKEGELKGSLAIHYFNCEPTRCY